MSVIQPGFCADSKRLPANRYLVKIPFVDLHAQYLSIKEDIDGAIADVIRESAFIRGSYVDSFEKAWSEALGVKHCISCANGTDALFIAMRALGIKPGDEVITTAHSWISTSETITQAGGRVVDWMGTDGRHGGKGEDVKEGISSRLGGLQAAVLKVNLPHLLEWSQARRRVAGQYEQTLTRIAEVVTPKVAPDRDHVYQLY